MDTALATTALLLLISVAAYVIHRLNAQHAERIALRTYSPYRPGHRPPSVPEDTGPPPAAPLTPAERHDHRDGGRGRHPARRRRDRSTHKRVG